MILYRRYGPGGPMRSRGLTRLDTPVLSTEKFAPTEDVKAMTFHKTPAALAHAIQRKIGDGNDTYAKVYKKTYPGTDAVYGTNTGDLFSGETRQDVNTGMVKRSVLPDITTTMPDGSVVTMAGAKEYADKATQLPLTPEEVDKKLFTQFYENEAATGRTTDHFKDLYKRLTTAHRLK